MDLKVIMARQAAQQEAYKKALLEAKEAKEEVESPESLAYKKAHSSDFPTEASVIQATRMLEAAEKEAKWLDRHDDGL